MGPTGAVYIFASMGPLGLPFFTWPGPHLHMPDRCPSLLNYLQFRKQECALFSAFKCRKLTNQVSQINYFLYFLASNNFSIKKYFVGVRFFRTLHTFHM